MCCCSVISACHSLPERAFNCNHMYMIGDQNIMYLVLNLRLGPNVCTLS